MYQNQTGAYRRERMYVGTEDLVPSMSMVNYSVLVVRDMKDCFVKKVSSMVGALGLKFRCCFD